MADRKIERLQVPAGERGLGLDLGVAAHGNFKGEIMLGLYSDFIEAIRYLTRDEAEAMRDWLTAALGHPPSKGGDHG